MPHTIRRAVLFSSVLLIGCEQEPVLETSTSQLAPSIESRVAGFDSWIEIDLDAMGRNLERIRERTGAEVMPVVKNNAYGHGLVPVVRYLMTQGCTTRTERQSSYWSFDVISEMSKVPLSG